MSIEIIELEEDLASCSDLVATLNLIVKSVKKIPDNKIRSKIKTMLKEFETLRGDILEKIVRRNLIFEKEVKEALYI